MNVNQSKASQGQRWVEIPTKPLARLKILEDLKTRPLPAWNLATRNRGDVFGVAHPLDQKAFSEFQNELRKASCLGLFSPNPEWPEPSKLEASLIGILGEEISDKLSYPRLSADGREIQFAKCRHEDTVLERRGNWRAAPAGATSVVPDFLLCPAMAMDSWGNRLGHGRGHYDRYLANHATTHPIAIIHSLFFVEGFPPSWIEDHDVPVEFIWTEKGIYRSPNFRTQTQNLLASKE